MLTLQTHTSAGWQTVGAAYPLADAVRAQQAAAALSIYTGAVWRVLGSGGRVLALWDGRRWQAVAEADLAPGGRACRPGLLRCRCDEQASTVPGGR